MKTRLLVISCLLAAVLPSCSRKPLSERIIMSEMRRCPDATWLDGRQGALKWNYTTGLELRAFQEADAALGLPEAAAYVKDWADKMASADGSSIVTYKLKNYNVDHICPGRIYFPLHEQALADGDSASAARYRAVLDLVRSQLDSQPRTQAGAFWHKAIYPHQLWLDGLYMALPFYAEYTAAFEEGARADSCYADIVHEFKVASEKTFDPATGLFRHAWDESRSMFWADPETGLSQHAWGRADGWYAYALAEVLDFIPEDNPGYGELVSQLQYLLGAVRKYADPATGMWYQVLDCPGREGNYLESTCSAMFLYAALKGVRRGWLDEAGWGEYSRDLYGKFCKAFIRENRDGTVSMTSCCAVGGLGGKQMRSGSFDYYLSEPIIENDCKGIGPFIQASLEFERL